MSTRTLVAANYYVVPTITTTSVSTIKPFVRTETQNKKAMLHVLKQDDWSSGGGGGWKHELGLDSKYFPIWTEDLISRDKSITQTPYLTAFPSICNVFQVSDSMPHFSLQTMFILMFGCHLTEIFCSWKNHFFLRNLHFFEFLPLFQMTFPGLPSKLPKSK